VLAKPREPPGALPPRPVLEERRVSTQHTRYCRIGKRRFEMPDRFESRDAESRQTTDVRQAHLVNEFVINLPCLASIVGALDQLAGTSRSTATRRVDSVSW